MSQIKILPLMWCIFLLRCHHRWRSTCQYLCGFAIFLDDSTGSHGPILRHSLDDLLLSSRNLISSPSKSTLSWISLGVSFVVVSPILVLQSFNCFIRYLFILQQTQGPVSWGSWCSSAEQEGWEVSHLGFFFILVKENNSQLCIGQHLEREWDNLSNLSVVSLINNW